MRSSIFVGLVVAGLALTAGSAVSQQMMPSAVRNAPAVAVPDALARGGPAWAFGPTKPHLVDAVMRTGYGLVGGVLFMGLGLGIDKLNSAQCRANTICPGNPVQTGVSFAFLGALGGATGPQLSSKCNRSIRAIFGLIGEVVGVTIASKVADVKMLTATAREPATFKTMGSALLGLASGAGVATAIC